MSAFRVGWGVVWPCCSYIRIFEKLYLFLKKIPTFRKSHEFIAKSEQSLNFYSFEMEKTISFMLWIEFESKEYFFAHRFKYVNLKIQSFYLSISHGGWDRMNTLYFVWGWKIVRWLGTGTTNRPKLNPLNNSWQTVGKMLGLFTLLTGL